MILKLAIEGTVQTLKISGSGVKNIAAALIALEENTRKGNFRTKGRMSLKNLMRQSNGQEVFDINASNSKEFFKACKSYGVLYVALKNVGDESDVRRILVRRRMHLR